jgi:DNA-binding MarR family transcriptional regulator
LPSDINSLSVLEQTTLFALYYACNGSIKSHVPEGAVLRGIASHEKGNSSKALKKLATKGLCTRHPTGRNTTYSLTIIGSKLAKKLLEQ